MISLRTRIWDIETFSIKFWVRVHFIAFEALSNKISWSWSPLKLIIRLKRHYIIKVPDLIFLSSCSRLMRWCFFYRNFSCLIKDVFFYLQVDFLSLISRDPWNKVLWRLQLLLYHRVGLTCIFVMSYLWEFFFFLLIFPESFLLFVNFSCCKMLIRRR